VRTLAVNFVLIGVGSIIVGSLLAGMLAEKVYERVTKQARRAAS
jgi:hypothetical protein